MWGFLGQTGLGMCATLSRYRITEGAPPPSILISKLGLGRQSFAIPKDPNAPSRVTNWDGEGQGSRKLEPMLVSERSQKLAQGWLVSSTTL